MSKSMTDIISEIEKKLERPNDDDEIEKYKIGSENIKELQDNYEAYTSKMYNCIDDLYKKPGDNSYLESNSHLINVLLPQLRFINELTHVVNSFPHKKLPTTTAFLAEMMDRAKYKMANITNFNGTIIGEPAMTVPQQPAPGIVPYQQINGGRIDDNDKEGIDDSDDSDDAYRYDSDTGEPNTEPDEYDPGDINTELPEGKFKKSSKRNPQNNEDEQAIVLDTSSEEESANNDEEEKETTNSDETQKTKKKKKVKDNGKAKNPSRRVKKKTHKRNSDVSIAPEVLSESTESNESNKSNESNESNEDNESSSSDKHHNDKKNKKKKKTKNKSSSSSSSSVIVEQSGGMKRLRRRIKKN